MAMANALKGEAHIDVGNVIYTLVFSMNSLCLLEEKTGKPFTAVFQELANPEISTMTTLRLVVWAALQEKHAGLTLKDAGNVIDALGHGKTALLLGELFAKTFAQDEGATANPPMPSQGGIGSAS